MPSKDGFDDAFMMLEAKLGYKTSADIKTKDLQNILKDLVKDEKNDKLALKVFYLILFMKVVIAGTSTRVSREAAMVENLVSQDMSQMDYSQFLVGDLKRVVIRYQQGTARGKVVTHCAIALLLDLGTPRINVDCLIHGKKHILDLRTPRINFMDQGKLYEARIVISHIERPGAVDLGHGRGNADHSGEAIDDGVRNDNIFPENARAPVQELAPTSDSFVAGVDDIVSKFDGVSVDSKKLANKHVSDIGCFDGLDQTEHKFSTSDRVFDGEQSKSTRGDTIINAPSPQKDSTEAAVEPGSTQAVPVKPLATEPLVFAGNCSTSRATIAEPSVVVILELPCATGTTEVDNTMHTGDCGESETEIDSYGKEEDLSRCNAGLGKNP
ncbi:hypothetical protein ZWY2020_024062 [Hordeum vulgare]|nr:hypothetical protein ZWY2020_024062 [Hordeum vulgare]